MGLKTKRIGIISGLLVLMFILVASASAQPPIPLPPFLSNLTITPAEIERGDDVTISLDIMNPNNQTFAYIVTMEIGELTLQVDSDMGVYESKTLSRTITPGAVGVYYVTVDGMTGNFTVNPKPSFWDKIPGFPYDSIILGLVTGIFVLWLLSRRKMTI